MLNKLKLLPKDFRFFLLATVFMGVAGGITDSVFNNFLNDKFHLTSMQRTFLEFPRETPGMLIVFISAAFFFMCNRTLAAFAQIFSAAGVICIGLLSFNYPLMVVWLFVFQTGGHLMLALSNDIGMELSKDAGSMGKRLGQLHGAGNLAGIIGSFIIFIGFRFLNMSFMLAFLGAGACFIAAFFLISGMKKNTAQKSFRGKLILRKEYKLFYWITVLYGTRKQIFLTFAPWVLVTVFEQKTEMIAKLLTICGIIGIGFKPLLGRAIDRFGERVIFTFESISIILICLAYGFSKKLFSFETALLITCSCYIFDLLLFSINMARATYLKKIAVKPEDVSSTLAMAVSLDHVFSIAIALIGGLVWKKFGYEYIFLMGAVIAVVNLVSVQYVKTGKNISD